MNQTEEWTTHPVYVKYECNANGEIRNKNTKKIMKQHLFGKYLYVHLTNNKISKFILAHRFILESFTGLNKLDVNHIDGNKTKNNLYNLEWVTKSQNCIHREEVIRTGNSKMIKCVETGIIYNSTMEASRFTKIHQGNINQSALGNRKSAGGYTWLFV